MRKYNPRVKEHSTTFYLSLELLFVLDEIARFHNVSRNRVIQRILDYSRKGGDYGSWEKSQKAYQSKKKICPHKNRKQVYKRGGKEAKIKQECLFNPLSSKWY